MNKRIIAIIIAVVLTICLLLAGLLVLYRIRTVSNTTSNITTPPAVNPDTTPTTQPTPPTSQTSGIMGNISKGPNCPVFRVGGPAYCISEPYSTSMNVETPDGNTVITTFTSDNNGDFKVNLNPGTYLITPSSNAKLPRAVSKVVTVNENTYTTVNFTFDTGIR